MEADAILGEQVYMAVTLLHAVPRQGVLTNEIVSGFPVIVFYHKTQQGQFRYQDPEAQCLPPVWIKT